MLRITRREFLTIAAMTSTKVILGASVARAGFGEFNMNRSFTVESLTPYKQDGIPDGVSKLTYKSGVDGLEDWALVNPPAEGKTWVVMIHGHGAHGDQIYTRPDLRDLWYPALRKHGLGVLSPNLRDNAWMSPAAAQDLHDMLNYMRKEHGATKFYLISGSMGGTSNLIYACLHPEDIAGVAALCSATDLTSYYPWCREHNEGIADAIEHSYGTTPKKNPKLFAKHSAVENAKKLTMPVYVVHGTADGVIPVSQPRKFAAAMGDASNFVYVEIADGGHDSPLGEKSLEALEWVLKKS